MRLSWKVLVDETFPKPPCFLFVCPPLGLEKLGSEIVPTECVILSQGCVILSPECDTVVGVFIFHKIVNYVSCEFDCLIDDTQLCKLRNTPRVYPIFVFVKGLRPHCR